MDHKAWIKSNLIPKLLEENKIGSSESKIVSCNVSSLDDTNNFMLSALFLVDIIFEKNGSDCEELALAIKLTVNQEMRTITQADILFFNEATMYSNLIPQLNLSSMFPKCYYTQADEENDIVVLENLTKAGYRTSDHFILPLDHIELVLKDLGKFHGSFYALKEKNYEKFIDNMSLFKESRYNSGKVNLNFLLIQKLCMKQALKSIDQNKYGDLVDYLMRKFEDPTQFYKDLVQPEEPLAVLCHGDFNRNNLLFKYDENGKVISMKIIDFQTIRYASPAIDLSFFLFMNVDSKTREENSGRLFDIYYESLISTLRNELPQVDLTKYSKDKLLDDYRRHVLYGFGICTFFLPTMLNVNKAKLWSMTEIEKSAEEIQAIMDEIWDEETNNAVKSVTEEALTAYSMTIST